MEEKSLFEKWRIMVEDIAWRIITVEDKVRFPKKTTKGLSKKEVLRRRVEKFRTFNFLKFRFTGKYF